MTPLLVVVVVAAGAVVVVVVVVAVVGVVVVVVVVKLTKTAAMQKNQTMNVAKWKGTSSCEGLMPGWETHRPTKNPQKKNGKERYGRV